jgi:very-short-patch-repair endonuclease
MLSRATPRARQLRRAGTLAENRLWYVLRNRQISGAKFVRQFPVGPYFADFACRSARLIVELDGSQHDGSTTDAVRTAYLKSRGYSVLRFWNGDVLHHRGTVVEIIEAVLRDEEPPEAVRFERGDPSPGSLRDPTSPRSWGEE